MQEKYAKLNRLSEIIKACCKILTKEDKELTLCSHSKKLATNFKLMYVPRGKPIHIYKNLLVCSDCRTITKFISKLNGRWVV